MCCLRNLLITLSLSLLLGGTVAAQGLDGLFQLDRRDRQLPGATAKKYEVSASARPVDLAGTVLFELKLTIAKGANSYSQAKDFAKPTVITVELPTGWTPVDEGFTPTPKPKREFDEVFEKEVEKLVGTTTFSRRFRVAGGGDGVGATLKGKIEFLLCDEGSCTPKTETFSAAVARVAGSAAAETSESSAVSAADGGLKSALDLQPTTQPGATSGLRDLLSAEPGSAASPLSSVLEADVPAQQFAYAVVPVRRPDGDPARVQFELGPATAQSGERVTLAITVHLAPEWTTYALQKYDASQIEMPTVIKFDAVNLSPVGDPVSVPEPKVHETALGDQTVRSLAYEDRVTWLQDFEVQAPGPYGLTGSFKFQICRSLETCVLPPPVKFSLGSEQQTADLQGALAVTESYLDAREHEPAPLAEASGAEALFAGAESESVSSLWAALWLAFLTGLIMNVMPCVLPVLAIKVLSLVQQAGESRARILGLNFAYTAGVLTVFFSFAILAWGVGQSLADVFQSSIFWVIMACVVFTMGLSLFGVFELPVPGIIPSANDHQEGYFGAFNTGIIATLLGTPCIGPFVVPFFTWTLQQTAPVVFLVFGMMGIGMASPYLMTGFFPALVNWLPRPGMWMVRFKQFTGFVLMGTVIWLMYSIPSEWWLPTLVLFLAISLLVWMMHNFSDHSQPILSQWKVYLGSLASALPILLVGIVMMNPSLLTRSHSELAWEPFSEERMVELRKEGVPMLIDFTADWCAICKVNESIALNTEATSEFVRKHNIVPLMADFTRENPEIQKWLKHFGQDSVPLTLIIPPGQDSPIIPLRGQYTKGMLLAKLEEAMQSHNTVTASEMETVRQAASSGSESDYN